jgi:hypothetical protein
MRQRNNRARKFMAEVELRSTKGIGVKWFDYMSYKVSGADLLKVLDILDGERDYGKRENLINKGNSGKKKSTGKSN